MKTIIARTALLAALALPGAMALTAAPAEAGGWKRCNHEGGFCEHASYFTKIRYGVGGRWAEKSGSGGRWCINAEFGDPAPGKRKVCEVYVPDWEKCTHEGGWCGKDGSHAARYGTSPHRTGQFVEASLSGKSGITCSNEAFGRDPVPGKRKNCWTFR